MGKRARNVNRAGRPPHPRVTMSSCVLLVLATLAGAQARAQAPAPADPAEAAPLAAWEPEFLKTLPHPADEPPSLLQPPPPPAPPPPDFERPYFAVDPLLDPAGLPPPGWFVTAEAQFVKVHVKYRPNNDVMVPGGTDDILHIDGPPLDWTVAPRIEVGRQLPSGFGAFAVVYRGMATQGSGTGLAPDGTAALDGRFSLNVGDFDYVSREMSLWPWWDMKVRIGARLAYVYFDSRSVEPFAVANAGTGVFERAITNSYVGMGPHVGLELSRRVTAWGFQVVGRADLATLLGRVRQGAFETSTTAGPDGSLLTGTTRTSSTQDVPVANGQLGIRWRPPSFPNASLFLGYQYDYWWSVGALHATGSRGDFWDQGLLITTQFHF